jgi:Bacterial protein of unknown function (DUF937)
MSMFFDLLSAINNPSQQASVGQLEALTGQISQLANGSGIKPEQIQGVMSVLGQTLQPALKQQSGLGSGLLENLMGQVVNSGGGSSALQSLLPDQVQQQIIQTVAQKVGLNPQMISGVLPSLIPIVMGFFNMGSSTPGAAGAGGNPMLKAFLDSDQDGDMDLGDMLKMANRFLQPAQP